VPPDDCLHPLEAGRIDLWLVSINEVTDQGLLNRYLHLLTTDEVSRQQAFRFRKDRIRYLVTRALVRTVLSQYVPIHPGQWRFGTNRYGKPLLSGCAQNLGRISFNISHTEDVILLALTCTNALGVDIEYVRSNRRYSDLIRNTLCPAEEAIYQTAPSNLRTERFLEYWTLKEAYVKARGLGMAIPFNHISFDLRDERCIKLNIHPKLNDFASRWQFWQIHARDEHIISLCAERYLNVPQSLSLKQIIPLQYKKTLAFTVLRESKFAD
jgi:4'-phosphopantetheinyl transferase